MGSHWLGLDRGVNMVQIWGVWQKTVYGRHFEKRGVFGGFGVEIGGQFGGQFGVKFGGFSVHFWGLPRVKFGGPRGVPRGTTRDRPGPPGRKIAKFCKLSKIVFFSVFLGARKLCKTPKNKMSHFVPTGRVIKYPPNCAPPAPRGAQNWGSADPQIWGQKYPQIGPPRVPPVYPSKTPQK